MALKYSDGSFDLDNGPSKFDIMLSHYDTNMGIRKVSFRNADTGKSIEVAITTATRCDSSATIWSLVGVVATHEGIKRVIIYYLSDTRSGRMRFEKKLFTSGVFVPSEAKKKAGALMEIIFRMVAEYQKYKVGHLSDKFFKLFEKAKRVHYSSDDSRENGVSLDEAIADISRD